MVATKKLAMSPNCMLSMLTVDIFLVYNSMAISVMVAQYHPDMPDKSQQLQLSPKLLLLSALFSGFISSALIWSNCYTSLYEFVPNMVIFVHLLCTCRPISVCGVEEIRTNP